jgi:ribonuclease E
VAEDAPTEDLSEQTQHAKDSQPEKLRVHSLARVLGTTSKRVLDALTELDGRPRSAQSALEEDEVERVREALADRPDQPDAAGEARPDAGDGDEPESRLMLETTQDTPGHAEYMPLFVAPQPVRFEYDSDDDDEDDDSDEGSDDDQSDRPSGRRRRRGRRGRGRGRGEQGGEDSDTDGDSQTGGHGGQDSGDDSDDSDDDTGDEDNATGEAGTRRRRRRRRRKAGSGDDSDGGSSPDDPPNTVVHEREPRKSAKGGDKDSSEIQGISGSTRLEAKRQRRRDGRDAGRRRPPILSEAEFLARREAVERTMVVRDKVRTEQPHEGARYTQIAVLEDGVVVEHFVTSAASASLVGNIYIGIVQNVLPSMEAAFVDIGRGRNGVLYAGEVNWEAAGLGGANRKIEQALKPGDYVVVQVSKDPVGHKGARLTTQVSLAGRYLVYVPGASSTGISRKLPDTERQRLKEILREVVPADAGVIIRTASEGVKEEDIRADVNRLQERWTQIEAKAVETKEKAAGAAVALYEEPNVLVKVIRDLFNEDFTGLIVSGDDAWSTINEYVNSVAPELVPRLSKYEPVADGPDVFAVHRIDEQLTKAMDRKVWLPSGGTLVIDRTEAMTVIDVNTGKFTGSGGNLEQTVTRNNLEAAEEIVRQLRLRDVGGIVVIDFIDMVLESNRDLVLRRLTEALARDRTRHQVSEVTSLGLVQLTRKRLGTGLIEAFSTQCTQCGGRGIVLHGDPVDSTTTSGRKSENGGRRGKRGKRGSKADDVAVAKVPAHPAGEHPMFKAMAAANGRHEDDEGEESKGAQDVTEFDAEVDSDTIGNAVRDAADEELEDEDFDESDEDESDEDDSDEDEIDLDDDEDDDIDDDIEVINGDSDDADGSDDDGSDDEDSDADDDDDEDDDSVDEDDDSVDEDDDSVDEDDDSVDEDDDSVDDSVDEDDESVDDSVDEDEFDDEPAAVAPPVVRHRRRAAARPAGPPIHDG